MAFVLIGALVLASAWDLLRQRIPNWLVLLGMLVGLSLQTMIAGLQGLGQGLQGTLVGFSPGNFWTNTQLVNCGGRRSKGVITILYDSGDIDHQRHPLWTFRSDPLDHIDAKGIKQITARSYGQVADSSGFRRPSLCILCRRGHHPVFACPPYVLGDSIRRQPGRFGRRGNVAFQIEVYPRGFLIPRTLARFLIFHGITSCAASMNAAKTCGTIALP